MFYQLINEKNKHKTYFEHKQTLIHLLSSCNKSREKECGTVKSFCKLGTQTLTRIPTIVFHSEPQNQIQIVYSWRTKRFEIQTEEHNFFEVKPNH